MNILVTGSSGYVASDLMPYLRDNFSVVGVDLTASKYTDLNFSIDSLRFKNFLDQIGDDKMVIVNLAAARFDFGATAMDYYKSNVGCHQIFTQNLNGSNVYKFIHISSVAALDGRGIDFSEKLNCDDAYRATKFLQEALIEKWCKEHDVPLIVLYPSAIFSDDPRSDTNIGKLQSLSKFIPLVPRIEVIKSVTYLPFFSNFIIDSVAGKIPAGRYLTIERPVLTVSEMIKIISGRSSYMIHIPFLKIILKIISGFLYAVGLFGKFDFKLTPNRVTKLFSETSYAHVSSDYLDIDEYASRNRAELPEILKRFSNGGRNE